MKKRATGSAMILVSAAGFGLMGVFAKLAYAHGMSVNTLLAYRFLLAALLFWGGIATVQPAHPRLLLREKAILCGLGVFGYAAMASMLFRSFASMSASMAELLFYTYPFMVCLTARIMDKERFTARKMFALAASFAGLLLLLGGSAEGMNARGAGLALGAAAIYAVFIAASSRLIRTVPPWTASAYITSSAGIALLLSGLRHKDIVWLTDGKAWGIAFAVAVGSTFIAILLFFEGAKRVGASAASVLSTFEPFVTLAAGAFWFGERLLALQWWGAVVMLGGFMLLAADFRLKPRSFRLQSD